MNDYTLRVRILRLEGLGLRDCELCKLTIGKVYDVDYMSSAGNYVMREDEDGNPGWIVHKDDAEIVD